MFKNKDEFDTASPLLEASVHTLNNNFYKPIKIRKNNDQYVAQVHEISGSLYDDDSYLEYYLIDNDINSLLKQISDKGCVLPESVFSQNFEKLIQKKEWFPEFSELKGKDFKLNYALSYEDAEQVNIDFNQDVNKLFEEAKRAGALLAVSGNSVKISLGSIDIYTTNIKHDGFNRAGDLINFQYSVTPTEYGKQYLSSLENKKEKSFEI